MREKGFRFTSDEEQAKLKYFAQTCTGEPIVFAIFTDEMQQRIYSYLMNL